MDNFKALSNILNQNYFGPNQQEHEELNLLKETALSSLALYYDKNECKKTVKESLEKYAYSDSDISRDANALLKKIQGKNNSEDLYINELLPGHSREAYKYLRSKYIEGIGFLDNGQKNRIDKALIPMFKPLSGLVNKGARFVVIKNNSVTSIFKEDIGRRYSDGRFYDSFPGSSKGKIAVSLLSDLNIDYIVAHECNHAFVMNVIKEEDKNELIRLYNQAKKHKRFLDDYSAKDYLEYFAVGYEAYLRTCESHSNIKNRDNKNSSSHSHTYLSLKYKDPDLYNFIECCLKKYDKNSYGDIYKKLDKVA